MKSLPTIVEPRSFLISFRRDLQPKFGHVVLPERATTRVRPVQRYGRHRNSNPNVRAGADDAVLAILVRPLSKVRVSQPDSGPVHGRLDRPVEPENDHFDSADHHKANVSKILCFIDLSRYCRMAAKYRSLLLLTRC